MFTPAFEFAASNIYKAVSQDSQFHVKLIKANQVPARVEASFYQIRKRLPDDINNYYTYIVGQINTSMFNLLDQEHHWYRDTWINFKDDINNRKINIMLYNQYGLVVPREYCWYTFIDESSLCICVKVDSSFRLKYDYDSIKYLRVYSNAYFNTNEFNSLPNKIGLVCNGQWVLNNVDKANLQSTINTLKSNGGDVIVYVNGYYYDHVDLLIENNSYVEYLYDQSIISKKTYPINSLRSFTSELDNCNKYLIYTDDLPINYMQFFDDYDFFVVAQTPSNSKGVYYYKHKADSCRNVTDKDYSLKVSYVDNLVSYLNTINELYTLPKAITLCKRKSGLMTPIIYSSLKLHELYKVPQEQQLDVLNSSRYSFQDLRCEKLENNDYFKFSQFENLSQLTIQLANSALEYDAITHYLAKHVIVSNSNAIDVPVNYRAPSTVFEYDTNGNYIDYYSTTGPIYIKNNPQAKFFEFLYGTATDTIDRLYNYNEDIVVQYKDFSLFKASFIGNSQITNWQEVTNYTIDSNNKIIHNATSDEKLMIVYYNKPIVIRFDVTFDSGYIRFPIHFKQDRGLGVAVQIADIAFRNIEIFLNRKKLTKDLDYFMNYPWVVVCNKTYFDYTKPNQEIEIRLYGPTTDYTKINELEEVGFIHHDVLSRNHKYDLKDDRELAFFIDGRMQDRSTLKFAETDNTVRTAAINNGKPYVIKQPFIPIYDITNAKTVTLLEPSIEKNKRFRDFFTEVLPEPSVDPFNVIFQKHYLYSPLMSAMINDILNGSIPSTFYSTPYSDADIIHLVDSQYSQLYSLDPIKFNLPDNIVEIHPHIGNSVINLTILQYRFISNVNRIFFRNKINLSGYLTVTA
jgi:hypothetical protein